MEDVRVAAGIKYLKILFSVDTNGVIWGWRIHEPVLDLDRECVISRVTRNKDRLVELFGMILVGQITGGTIFVNCEQKHWFDLVLIGLSLEGVGASCASLRDHFAVVALGEEIETSVLCWGLDCVKRILD